MNHEVESAKPLKATSIFATPSAQNRKQPTRPVIAYSVTSTIQPMTMKAMMARPCCVFGSRPSGANQIAIGTSTVTAWRSHA